MKTEKNSFKCVALRLCKVTLENMNDTIDEVYSPGRVIHILRCLSGLTQMELAGKSSKYRDVISQSLLSKIEHLDCQIPYDLILHLCSVVNVEPEKFFSYVLATQNMTFENATLFIAEDYMKKLMER